jgi:ATP-dependent DNA helicase RecQ
LNGEGKVIPFKKASLTHEGREMGAGDSLGVVLRTVGEPAKGGRKVRKSPVIKSGTLGTQSVPELTTEQKGLEEQLRAWRKAEAAKTGKPAFLVFSDAALRAVVVSCPRTVVELGTVSGFGPDKVERYGAAVCAICRGASGVAPVMEARSAGTQAVGTAAGTHPTEGGWRERAKAEAEAARLATFRAEVAGKPARIVAARTSSLPVQTKTPGLRSETWGAQSSGDPIASGVKEFRRERGMESDPTAELSEEQRALDERLRAWRKAESEKMGLPQFFVLGTSTLRTIVLERPKTLKQLQGIQGIGQEKLEKFGASILEVCNG